MPHFTRAGELRSPSLAMRLVRCDGDDYGSSDEQADANALWFVLKGNFSMRLSSGRLVADPSAAVSLREGEHFRISHPEGCGDLCLAVWGALANEVAARERGRHATTSRAFHRVRLLARSIAQACPPELAAIEEVLVDALASGTQPEGPTSRRERAIAEAAAHEIGMRFDEPLSLADLAAPLRVSIFALSRAFRRAYGAPVHRWHQRLRVRHALAAILDSGRPSLAAIAAECGFSSHAHLTALFRREIGATPSEVKTAGRRFPCARLPHIPRQR